MIESYLRQSPLAHLALAAHGPDSGAPAGVRMMERPFPGLVNLRGPGDNAGFHDAFKAAAGYGLPAEAGATAGSANTTALWLGPSEWLILDARGGPESGPRIAESLRAALTGIPAAVTDISESRACIRISGAKARTVLQKGCPLDLHPKVFAQGQCAQSVLAKAAILLHMTADDSSPDGPAIDVYVARSFAEYTWRWLEDAAREFGVARGES